MMACLPQVLLSICCYLLAVVVCQPQQKQPVAGTHCAPNQVGEYLQLKTSVWICLDELIAFFAYFINI